MDVARCWTELKDLTYKKNSFNFKMWQAELSQVRLPLLSIHQANNTNMLNSSEPHLRRAQQARRIELSTDKVTCVGNRSRYNGKDWGKSKWDYCYICFFKSSNRSPATKPTCHHIAVSNSHVYKKETTLTNLKQPLLACKVSISLLRKVLYHFHIMF